MSEIRLHRRGAGPPLLLLHGLGASRAIWDGFPALAARFELLSYDLPGHGGTPVPAASYDIADLANQLAQILALAGIARCHVVGTSLGGMTALQFAADAPERIDRLVLCDTSPALSDGERERLLTSPDDVLASRAMATADLLDIAEEIYAPTLVLCAEGAAQAMRDGADFLARTIAHGRLAFVPKADRDAIAEQPAWIEAVLLDFLG